MKTIVDLVVITYESIYHDLNGQYFEWVSETLKSDFEDNGYCYRVFVSEDRLELVVIWALSRYIMDSLERYKYKNIDSDMFEYLSSLNFVDIRWWNNGQSYTESNHSSSESKTGVQGDRTCIYERNSCIGLQGGKFA